MSLFTFVFPYKGGNYVKQVEADDVKSAATVWAEIAQKDRYGKDKERLPGSLQEELKNDPPVPLKDLTNAWCACVFSGRAFTILNIVRTVGVDQTT